MTESSELQQPITPTASPAKGRRREAKRRAWNCFFVGGNSLTLIAAALIPLIMYMALQGVYGMVYMVLDVDCEWIYTVDTVAKVLLVLLVLPLFGGTIYITAGIARGESRELKDIFYAYSSLRSYLRSWISLLIPFGALSAVVSLSVMLGEASYGLAELSMSSEAGGYNAYAIMAGGETVAVIAAVAGLLLCGFVMPFFGLAHVTPTLSLAEALRRSVAVARGHLVEWLMLQLSFLGWLLLSVATVGILLVLFTIPYYLLTVMFYIDSLSADAPKISD